MEALILAAFLLPAFIWLGYETRWLTIRLMVGDIALPEFEYREWNELWDWTAWNKLTMGADIEPVCGWKWIKDNLQVVPVYRIQLYYGNGYKQTMTLKNPDGNILKQAIKINTGKKYFRKLAAA